MLNLTYAPSTSQADSCASHKSFSCQIIFIQPYSIKRPTFSCLKDHRFLQWADAENACYMDLRWVTEALGRSSMGLTCCTCCCVRHCSGVSIHPFVLPVRRWCEERSCYHSWEHLARTHNLNFRFFISLASSQPNSYSS